MNGEIITIGNELISGRILNLNSRYAAGRITAAGLEVTRITTVGDDPEEVSKALKKSIADSRFVIITGGLGSTDDDMTVEITAKALDRPLCLDRELFQHIKGYTEIMGIEMSSPLEKMAWMPEGSRLLNPRGTTLGFCLREDEAFLYFLPGVPDQMRYLMDRFVLPEILDQYDTLPVPGHRVLKLYGLGEPAIAEILKDISQRADIIWGFYPHRSENHITFSIRGHDELIISKGLDEIEKELRDLLGAYVFASGNQHIEDVVGKVLCDRNITISVAESCTGGLIGNLLTNVSGSSGYFSGGMIVYSNQSKADLLNVSQDTIKIYGAVSDQTVREMAEGVKDKINTDIGLAVTGIAGPDGGTKEKPVGTVYIGLASGNDTFSGRYRFWGTRAQIKQNTSIMALDWVRRYLNDDPFLPGL